MVVVWKRFYYKIFERGYLENERVKYRLRSKFSPLFIEVWAKG